MIILCALPDRSLMSIKILVFASLSEQIGLSQTEITFSADMTADDAWKLVTNQTRDKAVRVAINQAYAEFDQAVNDGDELAFFPPVTGG